MKVISKLILIVFLCIFCCSCSNPDKAFKEAKEADNIASYEVFIQSYPDSIHVKIAKERIQELHWFSVRESNNIYEIKTFLDNHPDSSYINEATQLLSTLVWNQLSQSDDVNSMEQFINDYPDSEYCVVARQRINQIKWDSVRSQPTIVGIEKYIKSNPYSPYLSEARDLIIRFQKNEDFSNFEATFKEYYNGNEKKNMIAEFDGHEFMPASNETATGRIIDAGSEGTVENQNGTFSFDFVMGNNNKMAAIKNIKFHDGLLIKFTNGHKYKFKADGWVRIIDD